MIMIIVSAGYDNNDDGDDYGDDDANDADDDAVDDGDDYDDDDDHFVDGRHEVMWRMLEQIPNSRLGQLAR